MLNKNFNFPIDERVTRGKSVLWLSVDGYSIFRFNKLKDDVWLVHYRCHSKETRRAVISLWLFKQTTTTSANFTFKFNIQPSRNEIWARETRYYERFPRTVDVNKHLKLFFTSFAYIWITFSFDLSFASWFASTHVAMRSRMQLRFLQRVEFIIPRRHSFI